MALFLLSVFHRHATQVPWFEAEWMSAAMAELLLITALALALGFQSGCIASWRYYRNQRDEQDTTRRHYEARIEQLDHDLHRVELELRRERHERYQIKDS